MDSQQITRFPWAVNDPGPPFECRNLKWYILPVNGRNQLLLLVVGLLFSCPGPLYAEYTLVLKNGRRITVESYREEGGMIKFRGLGGEIGINREQIQSILKAGEPQTRGMSLSGTERAPVEPATTGQEEKLGASQTPPGQTKGEGKEARAGQTQEKVLSPEEKQAEERAKEEKEYQSKVRQLTEQIKTARDRYAIATRGSSGPEPTLLNSEEAIKARTDDLVSRLRDAQHNPSGPSDAGGVKLSTPSPFTGVPPTTTELRPGQIVPRVDAPLPGYSGKEKELSDLRNQINQLQREREKLIEQMKQKNFETGSLFLD